MNAGIITCSLGDSPKQSSEAYFESQQCTGNFEGPENNLEIFFHLAVLWSLAAIISCDIEHVCSISDRFITILGNLGSS